MINKRGKFGAKLFSHYTDIVIFVFGYFNLNHQIGSGRCLISRLTSNKFICVVNKHFNSGISSTKINVINLKPKTFDKLCALVHMRSAKNSPENH